MKIRTKLRVAIVASLVVAVTVTASTTIVPRSCAAMEPSP